MIVKIKKRENPFAMIDRAALEDGRLSWRARGVLAYLLSKPDDWEVSVQNVINKGKEGREAVRAVFRELTTFGYCQLENARGANGQLSGKRYTIYEQPKDGFSVDRTDRPENRPSGKPTVGKPVDIVIRKTSNKEILSNKEEGETSFPAPPTISAEIVPVLETEPEKEKVARKRKSFSPPTLEEARAYFLEKQAPAEYADQFWNYYEANGWKVGRNKMEKWHNAAAGWISRQKNYSNGKSSAGPGREKSPHLVTEETLRSVYAKLQADGLA